ncbi:MAG: AAA family ATPase [Candidatus Muiribacteriota bacterium]
MKIKELNLTSYRGIQEMNIVLHENMNIFFGRNGSGKSTILDCAAVLLSWLVSRIKHSGTSGRPVTENDITNKKRFSVAELTFSDEKEEIKWKLVKNRKGSSGRRSGKSQLSELTEYTKRIQAKIEGKDEQLNLPLFVYYPVNRAVFDIPLRIRTKHSFDIFAAYDDALTGGTNFRTFFEWFREREDLENENRKYQMPLFQTDDGQFPDPQLEAVRKALEEFLPDFKNLTVRRSPLRMEVQKNNEILSVNQLSDGEKCMIAMIGDLARRLSIANPVMENPLHGKGVVIIDEIDLHLHPGWQRMVIPSLSRVFKNIQFLISTHSPHVITHANPENLFLLKSGKEGITFEKPVESYGKNVDRVLEDLMGLETTRPDEISSMIEELYELISQKELDIAKDKLGEIKRKIGEDPELVKAGVLIKRQEILGK